MPGSGAMSPSKSSRRALAADPDRLARLRARGAAPRGAQSREHRARFTASSDVERRARARPRTGRRAARWRISSRRSAERVDRAHGGPRTPVDRPPDRRCPRRRARTRASSIATSSQPTSRFGPTARSKVLDFGLAKDRSGIRASQDRRRSTCPGDTRDGIVLGTARVHEPRAGARASRSTSGPTSGRSAACCSRC